MKFKPKKENHVLRIWLDITMLLWMLGLAVKEWYFYSLLVSIMSMSIFFYYIFLEYRVKKWTKTEGKCKDFYIQKLIVWNGGRNLTTRFRPFLLYEYIVGSNTYHNKALSILDDDYAKMEEKNAKALISHHSKNETLTVYYNPNNPEESVLLPEFSFGKKFELYVFLFFGITLLLKVMYYLV